MKHRNKKSSQRAGDYYNFNPMKKKQVNNYKKNQFQRAGGY